MSKRTFVSVVAVGILVLDQLSKWYIRETLPLHGRLSVVDGFFHITYVRNSGGAFSLFAGTSDAIRLPFFFLASTVALIALLYFLRQVEARERWLQFGLAAVLGGALGNLTDRITSGEVTDFLDVHWRGYHWPAFNVADSFITIGVVILMLQSLLQRGPHQQTERPPTERLPKRERSH